jgi:hypothetical protein
MSEKTSYKIVSVRIEAEAIREVQALAWREHRSLSAYLRLIIYEHLNKHTNLKKPARLASESKSGNQAAKREG